MLMYCASLLLVNGRKRANNKGLAVDLDVYRDPSTRCAFELSRRHALIGLCGVCVEITCYVPCE